MKQKKEARNNAFILNLNDEEAKKLYQIASNNFIAPSTIAYIIIKKYLDKIYLKDEHGNDIINL